MADYVGVLGLLEDLGEGRWVWCWVGLGGCRVYGGKV